MDFYRTSDVTEKAQFAYWHDVICRHFVPADSRLEKQSAFLASFETSPLGSFQVSRLIAPRHSWSRTAENLRRAPHDEFLLSLSLGGTSCLQQDGRELQQQPGELALYDTGRPFSYLLDSDIVLLKIPRHELIARLPQAGQYTAAAFGQRSAVGRMASRLLREALDLEVGSNRTAGQLFGSCVVDAVAAALEWELGGQPDLRRADSTLFDIVKAYVLSNLGNRSLDASRLAAHHGISVRTLNRLFAVHGSTPMRWVWSQRLRACYEALANSRAPVTQVAFDHGFADPSHFSRAFKAIYGITPREVTRLPKDRPLR